MKKMLMFISMLCVLNVLAGAGLLGFLWQTGRLDKKKAQTISDMLRRPGTPVDLREKVDDLMKPAAATQNAATQAATASAPASQADAALAAAGLPAAAEERIDYVQKTLEEGELRLAIEAQNLQHRQELLEKTQSQLQLDEQKLAEDKKVFEARLAAANMDQNSGGFDKAMSLFDSLKPKQVKDLLMGMQTTDAAKYLGAMDPDQAAKIIAEFKSPDEKTFLGNVVDLVRGAKSAAGTGAATLPSAAGAPLETADLAGPRARAGP